MTFDPAQMRDTLVGFQLGYERDKAYDTFLPSAVGNAAIGGVETAVTALLVGLDEAARPLVMKYRDWLEDAIGRKERFGEHPSFAAARRYEAFALATFLLDDAYDPALYRNAIAGYADMLFGASRPETDEAIRAVYVADILRDTILAERPHEGLAIWQRIGGRMPDGPSDARDEAELAALLCAAGWRRGAAPEPLLAAAERILAPRLAEDWLDRGRAITGAQWLMAVYFVPGLTHTAEATLMKAYDLVPGAARPARR